MRNLKRALSLTLASVMLLGMMVIGTSAVAGYSDVDADDNVEAIEVLQAIEVMVGDDRGFGPDRPVNRAEMAVVMGLLLNLDYNYYVSTCPFADVSGNYEWARGWVGACAANGIVSGRGEGIYDPGATVTAIEAASMMMRALGYFKYAEDYNDGFVLVTVRQGNQIGLFNGVGSDGSTPMTRNQVAQMALNALRSEMVDFTGTLGVELNGVKVNYRAEYTSRTSTEKKYNAIEGRTSDVASDANHKGQYYVQLGEELYDGKLRLNNSATDAFGRPSRHWEYDGKAIGTYMKKELLDKEWTTEVTGKDLYDLLGSDTIKNYSFDITIDGVSIDEKTGTTDNNTVLKDNASSYFDETYMAKTYKSGVGQTGKGVLTQVFVNADTKEVDVAVINTYLAKATADYNEKKDEAAFEVFALTSTNSGNNEVFYKFKEACKDPATQSKKLTIDSNDFAIAEDVKKDDIFLVRVANGDVQSITKPEVISAATLTAFSKHSYVAAEGTQYDYNTTVEYDPATLDNYTSINGAQQLKDTEYNVYLDEYGYLIGIEVVDAVKNYVFLTGIDLATSNLKNKTAQAAGILMDGTFVEFTMNMKDSEAVKTHGGMANASADKEFYAGPLWNTWCTYTVNKDGVYTLKEVNYNGGSMGTDKAGQWHDASYSGKDIDDKHVSLKSAAGSNYVYGNDNTVYIVAELDAVTSDTDFAANTIKMPDNDASADKVIKAGTDKVGIISGVDSIATGIANVNLKTWNATQIESEVGNLPAYSGNVYTLFDNDGYVIAAVVVGEDDGTTKNLVYSNKDSISKESYDKTNDEWTWERKVIFNGEEITLTEVGSGISVLESMKQNVWYEITYKADGTVKSSKLAYYDEAGKRIGTDDSTPASGYNHALERTTDGTTPGNAKDFVDKIEFVENAINNSNKSTVLYEQVWGKGKDADDNNITGTTVLGVNNAPSLKGSTLYVNTDANKGFYVSKDVKSVLIQKNDGKSTTTYGAGTADLENMLEDLNFNADVGFQSYCFKISAILTNGRATTVIIHDWNETGATPDGSHGGTPTTMTASISGDVITIAGYAAQPVDEIADTIVQTLRNQGYSNIKVKVANGMVEGATAEKNDVEYTFTVAGVPTAADVKATLDAKVAALATTLNVPGKDPEHDETSALAAIKTLEVTDVNDDTIKVEVALKAGASFSAAANAAKGGTATDGTAFKCVVTLSKNGQSATAEVTVTMKGLAYTDTEAGKAEAANQAKVDAAETAVNALTAATLLDGKTYASTSAAEADIKAAVAAAAGADVTLGYTFSARTEPVADTTPGKVTVVVTIDCGTGATAATQKGVTLTDVAVPQTVTAP